MVSDYDKREVDRVENLLSNFDWKLVKTEVVDGKVVLTIIKPEVAEEVKPDLGPA